MWCKKIIFLILDALLKKKLNTKKKKNTLNNGNDFSKEKIISGLKNEDKLIDTYNMKKKIKFFFS